MNHNSVIQTVVEAAPAFPPSFDNDPWLFGWALFSRLVIFMLASATVIRLLSRNRFEGITAGHPVFYHRMVVMCFCASTWLGSGSDAITYLMWGEISTTAMGVLLIVTKAMDGLTMIPFIMALFVPFWMTWARWSGIVPMQKGALLTGTINDLRVTWVNGAVPFKLVLLTAAVAGLVSVSKYAAWAAHVRV